MTGGRGFSLFELAIVIFVSGLLLIGLMRLFEALQQEQALKTTRARIEKIQKALDVFADRNERFPCPLPPAGGPMAAEPATCINPDLVPGARDVARGILPAAPLDLKAEDVRDGWGNMFTYAVSAALTRPTAMRGVTPPPGVIGMVNGTGENLLETPNTGRYVIISHGPGGRGGFTPQGTEIPCRDGTLSARNCHKQADFVAAVWSSAPGPLFFDNIVAGDGSRRQARLLEHLDACARLGRYYAPERFYADQDGCVADDKVYGACTVETSYMQNGANSPFTGAWDEPPQVEWLPAKLEPGAVTCQCRKDYTTLKTGTWELPLHHWDPPLTVKQSCHMAAQHEESAIANDLCDGDPPSLDIREAEWVYDYLATEDGRVFKQSGSQWKPEDGKNWQIMPVDTLDPDTGKILKAKAAAHRAHDRGGTRVRRITFSAPIIEQNHKLALFACVRK